ncbi:MAG: RnfH family protein [Burkholderiales bacterium]
MKINVIYALPMEQHSVVLDLPEGASAEDAISHSGLLDLFPEIAGYEAGIWGKPARLADFLREGDRVEIYRPLAADPKEARLRRVARTKKQSR